MILLRFLSSKKLSTKNQTLSFGNIYIQFLSIFSANASAFLSYQSHLGKMANRRAMDSSR